jgi:hypothetical protein
MVASYHHYGAFYLFRESLQPAESVVDDQIAGAHNVEQVASHKHKVRL